MCFQNLLILDVHPGECPKPSMTEMLMRGPCDEDEEREMCLSDEGCGTDMKCCYNGCHRTCEHSQS